MAIPLGNKFRAAGLKASAAVVLLTVGAAGTYAALHWKVSDALTNPPEAKASAAEKTDKPKEEEHEVKLPESKWAAAGLRIVPVVAAPLPDVARLTGRITLNEDASVAVTAPTDGIIRESHIRLGQEIKAGDVLAVLDSKAVGEAKHELAHARVRLKAARLKADWQRTVARNTQELLTALDAGTPIGDLDAQFREKPMGEWRQQLVGAYARRTQFRASYLRSRGVTDTTGLSESGLLRAKADYEEAEATFQATRETIRAGVKQQELNADISEHEAIAAESLARAHLYMLGYDHATIDTMDCEAEGPTVSYLPIRTPFAGTVIEKKVTRGQRVGPQSGPLFQITDLSSVWVQADVFAAEQSLTRGLVGTRVGVRLAGRDDARYEAEVFSAGEIVDRQTRAVPMTAVLANPDRRFKPGQFVEIELPRGAGNGGPVVQVPAAAVVQHEGKTFVFIHEKGDEFQRVEVTLGRTAGDTVEIRRGLKAGQPLVVEGAFALKSEILKATIQGE